LHSVPQKYAEGNDFPPLRDNENKLNNRRGTQTHKYTSKQRHESKTVGVPYAFLFLGAWESYKSYAPTISRPLCYWNENINSLFLTLGKKFAFIWFKKTFS